jgi:D-sedoheptulose 7-phosphate isomerase
MPADSNDVRLIQRRIQENIKVKESMLRDPEFLTVIAQVSRILIHALRGGHKLMLFGNGGSAADAQHIATELVARYLLDRVALPAMALTVNSSAVTAISNDDSFDNVFSRQVEAFGAPGDIAVAISTSGNSRSVLSAVQAAKCMGLLTVSLTGKSGGKLRTMVDHCLCVPSEETPRIQECHILIGHILCEIVEAEFSATSEAGRLRCSG